MRIVVLNGSPKGKQSITLQYVNFLRRKYPGHEFEVFHVSQTIKGLEKNEKAFGEIIEAVRSADGVLWSFGLWVLAVSAQLMRFIELISERGVQDAFRGKYTAAVSTSIHYYDHTAHNYIRGVCEDLEMHYVDGFSLDILDMMNEEVRKQLCLFADNFFGAADSRSATSTLFPPITYSDFEYRPSQPEARIPSRGQRVLVLTDRYDRESNLGKMIDRFRQSYEEEIEVIDLREIDIKGACIGCMQCGYDYTCQYQDGFTEFYNDRVRAADVLVFAGAMQGRYLSSLWKTFYDRAFFWNHTPSLSGKQMGYLVSGPLTQNANLIQILEASTIARQHAGHVDIITDESGDSPLIDAQLQSLAERLVCFSESGYLKPQNFLGVGGHKIFRDDVWGRLRPLWQADHRHYRKHGFYDFPQRDLKVRLMRPTMMLLLTCFPSFRRKFYQKVKGFPAKRFSKLIDKLVPAKSQDGGTDS